MSKVKEGNFIVIPSILRSKLDLKGNELLIASIVYGFSQDRKSEFTGSINYLVDWTGASRSTIIRTLSSLTEKNIIIKNEIILDESGYFKMCKYSFNFDIIASEKQYQNETDIPTDKIQNETGGSVKMNLNGVKMNLGDIKMKPNNIDNNIDNNIEKKDSVEIPFESIINYLNEKANKHFRVSKANKKLISGRWNEGYTLDDFIHVIDVKCNHWINDPKMKEYLQPSTLFRPTNFENYVNQEPIIEKNKSYQINNSENNYFNESDEIDW